MPTPNFSRRCNPVKRVRRYGANWNSCVTKPQSPCNAQPRPVWGIVFARGELWIGKIPPKYCSLPPLAWRKRISFENLQGMESRHHRGPDVCRIRGQLVSTNSNDDLRLLFAVGLSLPGGPPPCAPGGGGRRGELAPTH